VDPERESLVNRLEQQLKPLMLLGLTGDAAAQRKLLEACAERLRDYFHRRLQGREADVEDLVQETLIAIHERRASYDVHRPFTVWLHAIARYKLADMLRRRSRRREFLSDAASLVRFESEAPELGVTCDVDRLLDTLPEAQREAVRLTKLEGLSVAEAADRTGLSKANVKVLTHRAMKALMAETRKTKH
jgi:RNA polymerase sigma-70 factor (ECF subfamily)